ncbi:MAG: hypothetical protein HC861_00455 [Rhodospirillaceae bacterium]|nr:hypothetical protein [Rhodospirillaceae bacterium]
MDSIAEVIVRVVGEILREIFEALFRAIFGQIARFIGFIYNGIHRIVRWNTNSDLLATPVTILLMLALGGATFFAAVKAIQWMVA